MGAPSACEDAGVPNVSYNGSTAADCPETYLVSSRIDWTPYYVYAINCVINGEEIAADWTGTLETGSVVLTELGENVAEGTQEAIDEAMAALEDGSLHVFDTSTFTVDGETVDHLHGRRRHRREQRGRHRGHRGRLLRREHVPLRPVLHPADRRHHPARYRLLITRYPHTGKPSGACRGLP